MFSWLDAGFRRDQVDPVMLDSASESEGDHIPLTRETSVSLESPGASGTSFPEPFLPPSQIQPERVCPPLPSIFPALPINQTPKVVATAVRF